MGIPDQRMVQPYRLLLMTILLLFASPIIGCSNNSHKSEQPNQASGRSAEANMRLYMVNDAERRDAVCLDGSSAAYYFQPGSGEGKSVWVIVLGGGGACKTPEQCSEWVRKGNGQASSRKQGKKMAGHGILSSGRQDNPYFYNANKVFIPLCSADLWVGNNRSGEFNFRGVNVVRSVVEDLFPASSGRHEKAKVLLAGNSGGCIGESKNLDWLSSYLGDRAEVKGHCDGGWLLIEEPYRAGTDSSLTTEQRTRKLGELHQFDYNTECEKRLPAEEHWKCGYPSVTYPFVRTPQFIRVGQYDFQMLLNLGVDKPLDNNEKEFARERAERVRSSLANVPVVFSSNSHFHTVIMTDRFSTLEADGVSFMKSLADWFYQDKKTRMIQTREPVMNKQRQSRQ